MNRQKRAYVLGAIVALGGLTAGCDPGSPAPTPSPSASSPVTPTVAASPPETEQERQQRAFDSAEQSYRAFQAEYARLRKRGYSGGPTEKMTMYAGGPYLKAFTKFLREDKGTTSVGNTKIVGLVPKDYSPEELSFRVCEDARAIKNYDKKGALVSTGVAVSLVLRARPTPDRWIIWDGDDEEVESSSDG